MARPITPGAPESRAALSPPVESWPLFSTYLAPMPVPTRSPTPRTIQNRRGCRGLSFMSPSISQFAADRFRAGANRERLFVGDLRLGQAAVLQVEDAVDVRNDAGVVGDNEDGGPVVVSSGP